MTLKNTILKMTAIFIVVFSFTGCENDFDPIGSEIIGGPGFDSELYDEAEISARNVKLGPVQTNNLFIASGNNLVGLNLFGVYKDPVFGLQQANVLSQLSLPADNPDFGTEPVLDSVVLNIPYFSTEGSPDDEGQTEFTLDSIYGNGPINLSIRRSNLFLNNYDPGTNFETAQKYYSDLDEHIESNLIGDVLFEQENFRPSPDEVVMYEENAEGEMDTLTLAPRMRLKLSNEFFQENILDKAGSAELSSNNSFQNFLRGLYFKAEPVNNDGTMMLLNFRSLDAGITLYYTSQVADTGDADEDEDTEELVGQQNSYKINFGQNIVNTFEQELPQFEEDRLYLKGGGGSMAVINLFSDTDANNNGVSDDLESLRENNWLINEANLTFYVDQQKMAASREPERIFIYDLNNNVRLSDYVLDTQGSANNPSSTSNNNHLGPLVRDESDNGVSYKLRITEHIRRVINADSTNVKLGLVVSQNVNVLTNSAVKGSSEKEVKRIPISSIITPLGTVLYGPDAEDEEKRLRLQIYYTEPKN